MLSRKPKSFLALMVALSILLAGCAGRRLPNLEAIFAAAKERKGKRPVIIIPGILGSELVNEQTGETAWLNFYPAKGDDLALPVSPRLAENRDSLVARRIIERARVFSLLPEVSVYQALIGAMQNYGGYREASWENPPADGDRDTFYVFAYDWRRDNVENARLLVRKIEELKQKLGAPNLRFNVIAHSMGGLITRYAAMYGDADLPADGAKPAPTWAGAKNFNRVFMFGVPNEGSMSAFESAINGYTVDGLTGKIRVESLNSEAVFTSPAVFQLLPHQNSLKFYDENLKPLDVDLYDAENWRRYGWGAIANRSFLDRLTAQTVSASSTAASKNEQASGSSRITLDDVNAYFAAVLARAKLFHAALDADAALPPGISFFAFGSDCDPTLDGAILRRDPKTGKWLTQFSAKSYRAADGTKITAEQIRRVLYAPGDRRVTRRSLLAETLTEMNYRNSIFRLSFPVTATLLCEEHSNIPNNKIVQNNFLTALLSEVAQ
jgi:pimeloyl-ACP methyl ester carboxylesterase